MAGDSIQLAATKYSVYLCFFQLHIEQLTKQVDLQREKLKQDFEEQQLKEEKQKAAAATKIQTAFRGFRYYRVLGSIEKGRLMDKSRPYKSRPGHE